jgi:hypothetical protein
LIDARCCTFDKATKEPNAAVNRRSIAFISPNSPISL